ncbi:MAG: T9SS type A sorting domain-containing protein [Ignavibacteria bacterium]|nr:T9SS type A sorting domain-containing protein [Ignavibacteria bacterium]
MKKMMLLCSLFVLLQVAAYGQAAYAEWVDEIKGDTLVIKDFADMGDQANSLYEAINADSVNVPDGRVYLLKDNGWYPVTNIPTTSNGKKIIIMGESNESIKLRKSKDSPAVLSGYVCEGTFFYVGIKSGYDLLVKNISANVGNPGGLLGWTLFGGEPNSRLTVQNCILEHNQWCMINPKAGSKVIFKDNYIVNLVGSPYRRNGGIIDYFANQDTIVFENNTVINAQGDLFRFRSGYTVNRSIFNHNTFINCAGSLFMNMGNTGNISLTNNLFVNSNVQAHCSLNQFEDSGYGDVDGLPMGLVNVYDDSLARENGITFYADKNAVYWSPIWDDYIPTLIENHVNLTTEWYSQRIIMNSRTADMFADDCNYPYLCNGEWIEGVQPNFTEPQDLFNTQLNNLKTYALACVDTASVATLPNWRLVFTPIVDYFVYADFPIPVDLSYSNPEFLTAGLGGFPIGDLNWFPSQYAEWEAQKASEYEGINSYYYHFPRCPDAIEVISNEVKEFALEQNFPNPFNPSTVITYSIPKASMVTLKVYDVLGKEVATLVNEQQNAATYKVDFDASALSSGVYLYKIEAGNYTMTKKMSLLR